MSTQKGHQEGTVSEEFVARCHDLDRTTAADERAHTLVRDLLGVMLGSAPTVDSSRMVSEVARMLYGEGEATVVGATAGAPVPTAAFTNGAIAHGIELDDTHSGASVHPGAVVIPTALAVGEAESATGEAFLDAVVAGYECMIRISRAADPAVLYGRGFHPTATCGTFGAALTAAKLLGLDAEETVNAVGLAGSYSAGNQEYLASGTLSKRIQPGIAAQAGVQAASLAALGYTGPETVLEGTNGFLTAYANGGEPDRLFADVDDDYELEITRTGIKPHACCRYNQTPIDAALALQREHGIDASDIESIHVGLVEPAMGIVAEPRADKVRPTTSTAAQFSVQYSVAVALVHDRAFLEQFADPYLTDEAVRSLAASVTAEHDESLDGYYPDYFPARVAIETTRGETYETMLETCRGDPANPLDEAVLDDKFRTLAGRSLDETRVDEVEEAVADLTTLRDISELTALLRSE